MRAVKGAEPPSLRSSLHPLTSNMSKPRRPSHLVTPSLHHPNRFSEAEHCVMASSDSAVKQILLTMNEKDNFIVEDLDDFHIIIKADEEYRVRKQLELEVRCYSKLRIQPNGAHVSLSWRRTRTVWNDIFITNTTRSDVCILLIQARSHIQVSLQLPRYPGGELEGRQRPSERSNNLFHAIPQS